jgi:hypothetical protein
MNAPLAPTTTKYDTLIETLRVNGQTWTIDRLEAARINKGADLTVDEAFDAFGDPELNEKKAAILVKALTYAGMY